jgi:hypothetical protein
MLRLSTLTVPYMFFRKPLTLYQYCGFRINKNPNLLSGSGTRSIRTYPELADQLYEIDFGRKKI